MPLKYIRYLLQVMMVYQQQWEKHASKYGEGTVFYGSVKCLFDSMFGEEYEWDEMQERGEGGERPGEQSLDRMCIEELCM